MKSKARVEKRITYIKSLTDPIKALHELADLTLEIGEEACEELGQIRELTEKNRIALIGNGAPNNSVIGRLLSVEQKMDLYACDIKEIKDLLIGGISQKGLSLKMRVEKFEDYMIRSERLQWFTITAIIGYVIAQILMAIF